MKKNYHLIGLALGMTLLSACKTTDDANTVLLGDKEYSKDADGTVILSEADLSRLKAEYVFMKGEHPNASLSKEEYDLVLQNDEAMFSLVGNANPDPATSTLIRPGSLKKNIERIVSENEWSTLHFKGPDFFIEQPSILEEVDVSTAVMNLAADYPVYTCFEEETKTVTIIPLENE